MANFTQLGVEPALFVASKVGRCAAVAAQRSRDEAALGYGDSAGFFKGRSCNSGRGQTNQGAAQMERLGKLPAVLTKPSVEVFRCGGCKAD